MQNDFTPRKRPAKAVAAEKTSEAPQLKPIQTTDTSSFQTPDQVAADDDLKTTDDVNATQGLDLSLDEAPKSKASGRFGSKADWKARLALHWPPGKKEAIVAVVVILLIAGVGTAVAATHHSKKPVVASKHKVVAKPAPKPTTVPSTLSGLPVAPELNQKPVTGVMIENSVDARPQAGLSQAGVVFEAIAEGGITRFLALFQDTAPDNVGPIRSARPYYEQWLLGFDAGYAHVGGSPEALANMKPWNIRDLDQFANGNSYHRITTRQAPHNVYTSIATLNELEAAKGYTSSKFTGFARKKEAPAKAPTAKTVNIAISGPIYNVHYDYVAATNSYNRSEGGAAHIDANTNLPISPKVVIALVMPYGLAADAHHSDYNTLGTGAAYVYQDGTVSVGTWTKPDNTTQFTFKDAAGKPLLLNPGQTWLTAVGSASNVTSAP